MKRNFCYRKLRETTFALEHFWLRWAKEKFAGLFADKCAFGIALHLVRLMSKQGGLEANITGSMLEQIGLASEQLLSLWEEVRAE